MSGGVWIPFSIGDLYDKISILEIKRDRISDADKLRRVVLELDMLNEAAEKLEKHEDAEVLNLRDQLRLVNETIWDAEKVVRERERPGVFDDSFLTVARSTYGNNDRRAAIKRKINLMCGSTIMEEKSHVA